jgi:sugar phosphate isomerase/epimerase
VQRQFGEGLFSGTYLGNKSTHVERISTARHLRVFPGEGVHSVAELVMRLDRLGYRGDYNFEVFNDDYQQMPLERGCVRLSRGGMVGCRRAVLFRCRCRIRRVLSLTKHSLLERNQ